MRPGLLAAIALVTALLGGVAALLVGRATEIVGTGETTTVFVSVSPVGGSTGASAATAPSTARPRLGNGFDPAAIYAERASGVVTLYAELGAEGTSQGSGFVVGNDGTVLTNAHVITNLGETQGAIHGAQRVFVEFIDGDRVPATIVGWDAFSDVGAVRIDPKAHRLEPLPLGDSSAVVVGAPVAAIGSPFGNQGSLSVGVVAATGRSIPSLTSEYAVADAIQVDAPINRGNSGGPLLDALGRVIGINAQIRSTSGTAEGVGFAIPINLARRALEQLVSTGRVAYAYIGVTTQDVTPGLARRFGLGAERGALIASVGSGTPAESAGLRGGDSRENYNGLAVTLGGDVIVKIGDRDVRSSEDVSRIVTEELLPGQRALFVILRAGKRQTVGVTLVERPPDPSR